jgi:hypothetical protein
VSTSGQMIVSDPDSDDDANEVKRHSSDSDDEELVSLPRIRQQPEPNDSAAAVTTEAMDTSTVDGNDSPQLSTFYRKLVLSFSPRNSTLHICLSNI